MALPCAMLSYAFIFVCIEMISGYDPAAASSSRPPVSPDSRGASLPSVDFDSVLDSFSFTASKGRVVSEDGVSCALATEQDLSEVIAIQENCPADPLIHLSPERIAGLVSNRQVILASIQIENELRPAGAIFFHCGNGPESYDDVSNPAMHSLQGQDLYDFWIITRNDRRKSVDGTTVAKTLIQASDYLADRLDNKGVVAYSRAGHAILKNFTRVGASSIEDLAERVSANPAYKAQLLLRYFLSTKPLKQNQELPQPDGDPVARETLQLLHLRSEEAHPELPVDQLRAKLQIAMIQRAVANAEQDSSPEPFLKWLEAHNRELLRGDQIERIMNPSSESGWNPAAHQVLIRKIGWEFRRFIDASGQLPIDPTLGGFHTRLGGRLNRIRLDSRPNDIDALGANIEMRYR